MKKGIVNIHGRKYRTVALRVQHFRETCTLADGWGLHTELIHADEKTVIMKSWITHHNGTVVATGYAEETRTPTGVNSTSALENAETSAIGRALAAAGFGGDEYASADEMMAALAKEDNLPGAVENVKPWLDKDTPEWRGAVRAIQAGKATVGDVLKKRRLKNSDRAELEAIQNAVA